MGASVMEEAKVSEEKKTKTHQIAADINNIVIVLLRMEQMQRKLPEIMLQKPDTDENEDEVGGGDSEANPDAAEPNYDGYRNEDAQVET